MEFAKKYIQSMCGGLILMCTAAAPVHAVVQTAIFDGNVELVVGDLTGTVREGLVKGAAFGAATTFDDANVNPSGGDQLIGYESLDIFFGGITTTFSISPVFTDPISGAEIDNLLRFFDDELIDIIARDFLGTDFRLILGFQSLSWSIFDTSAGDVVVLGNLDLNPGGAGQPVSLPASLPLLLSALGIFGLVNRRKRVVNPA